MLQEFVGFTALFLGDATNLRMIWTSWIDPEDTEVNFHRPEMFGKLLLKEGTLRAKKNMDPPPIN